MAPLRHEIPTHLGVEDKAFYGLSVRQFTYLTVGLAGTYGLWQQWPELPLALRLGLALACLLLALAVALLRPHGRGLEEWLFVLSHYLAVPKVAVWRPREPEPGAESGSAGDWQELSPRLAWREEGR